MRSSILYVAAMCAAGAFAQPEILTREQLLKYTPDWKGERFADGRLRTPFCNA